MNFPRKRIFSPADLSERIKYLFLDSFFFIICFNIYYDILSLLTNELSCLANAYGTVFYVRNMERNVKGENSPFSEQ